MSSSMMPVMNRMYAGYMPAGAKRGATLRFTPPGFKHAVDVPFPGRVLPVCQRCKKNYKTREHCRTKEQHHNLPWADTYMCMTFDQSCFNTDGSLRINDGPFHAHGVQSQPYIYPEEMKLDPKTPSCAQCKDKNYTRTYCRTSKKHRTLPWSTVYVVLTMETPPLAGPPSPEKDADGKKRKAEEKEEGDAKKAKTEDGDKKEENAEEEEDESGSIWKKIPESRTVLCTVSITKNEVKWVDMDAAQAQLFQQRNSKMGVEEIDNSQQHMYPPAPYMMHPSQMHMGMGMYGHPMHGYGMPGQAPPGGEGTKAEDGAAPAPPAPGGEGNPDEQGHGVNGQMDGQQPWMGQGGQYPPDMMYGQMMDPRMAGYGYPAWNGRGYPGMEMGGPGGQGEMPPYGGENMPMPGYPAWGGPPDLQGYPGMGGHGYGSPPRMGAPPQGPPDGQTTGEQGDEKPPKVDV